MRALRAECFRQGLPSVGGRSHVQITQSEACATVHVWVGWGWGGLGYSLRNLDPDPAQNPANPVPPPGHTAPPCKRPPWTLTSRLLASHTPSDKSSLTASQGSGLPTSLPFCVQPGLRLLGAPDPRCPQGLCTYCPLLPALPPCFPHSA